MLKKSRLAFTLIELLIVVAIIAILAAIAVPNFLEAQVRAKVSRAKSDMRTLATALESYVVDNNKYPVRKDNWRTGGASMSFLPPFREKILDPEAPTASVGMKMMTTPIAYVTSIPKDPFNTPAQGMMGQDPAFSDSLDYMDPQQTDGFLTRVNNISLEQARGKGRGWTLFSVGPDRFVGNSVVNEGDYPPSPPELRNTYWKIYDPTNGTVSSGNIYRFQGDLQQHEIVFRQFGY